MTEKVGRGLSPALNKRRHARTELPKNTRAVLRNADGFEQDVDVLDISAGGAGLLVSDTFENNAFVELHMEGMGSIKARVTRDFVEGIGSEFDLTGAERKKMEEELLIFRKAVVKEKF